MTKAEALPTTPTETSDTPESKPRVTAFKTAKGSVYQYDSEGKTTRFKATTGEQHERQDLTVFAELSPEEEQAHLLALHLEGSHSPSKVYVVERQPDDSALTVKDRSQVKFPDQLYLAIVRDGKIVSNTPASLIPHEGANVFDTRHFEGEGKAMTERHLGNKVTEISYAA